MKRIADLAALPPNLRSKALRVLAAAAGFALLSAPAFAAPGARPSLNPKQLCVAAHEQAQQLRTDNKPHAARARYVVCAKTDCPVVVRKECTEQLDAMDATAPTITLEALDDKGNTDTAVKVTLDGISSGDKLTGAAIDVEPGEHAFVFERASDGKKMELKVLIVEGEKNRKVTADFQTLLPKTVLEPAPAAVAVSPPKKVPLLAYVAGGVAAVALGSFAFFSISGRTTESDLADSCAPRCTGNDVSPVKRDYIIGDVSLGVAIFAAAAAVILALPAFTSSSPRSAASLGPVPWMPKVRLAR